MNKWSYTYRRFVPGTYSKWTFDTVHDNVELADVLITDHMRTKPAGDRTREYYRVEDYGDELAIYVRRPNGKNKWRKLLNLQLEG